MPCGTVSQPHIAHRVNRSRVNPIAHIEITSTNQVLNRLSHVVSLYLPVVASRCHRF